MFVKLQVYLCMNYQERIFSKLNKKMSKKKSLNKILIWIFLWTAIWWLGIYSKTKKWKSFFQKLKSDIKLWINELKYTINNLINNKNEKK